jgi:hypothetical protein
MGIIMAIVEIFRFENEHGVGMYYACYNANDVFEWDEVAHPVPESDSLLMSNLWGWIYQFEF